MDRMRKRIFWQAGLAGLTVVLTVVIVFSMTAAWYTNIVHTNGLTFEAEAWGFKGNITVSEEAIQAAPGDDGVIYMEVENEDQNIAAVSVNVSKARMDAEMQKRLFFYVDTQQVRNDETMERVYLNNQENYTYTLFSNSTLTLTETMHNDAQLKWHWVYDVLGYYVLGTANEEGTDVTEMEYLRPIEYDYDAATTTFETVTTDGENGQQAQILGVITTVDGKTTVEEFLTALSATDGYEGTIDTSKKLKSGHYPVDVDENGYGVYAYLCNYAEIELATQFDTALGQAAAEGTKNQFEAILTVSAQKNENSVIPVATLSALETAMTLEDVDVIQLTEDITIGSESLVIADGQKVMLDLNENQIISTTTDPAIKVQEGSSLTMINGSMAGTEGTSMYAIESIGAEVVLSNVNIDGYKRALHVSDNSSTSSLDSKVRLVGCQISTTDTALLIRGNGSNSATLTQVIVEDCTIHSDDITICGNGNSGTNGQYGTDIQIIGSTITSNKDKFGAGIYHPQKDSYLTIYNSTVSGYTGMCIKGGTVSVVSSTIKGEGTTAYEAMDNGSGFSDTADAVYIDTGYGYDISLRISEDTALTDAKTVLTSDQGLSLQVFEETAENVSIQIYSGTFDQEQNPAYIDEGSEQTGSAGNGYIIKVKNSG